MLTGVKDTDFIILSKLNDRDLLSACQVNKEAFRLCRDENFWRNRFIARYGQQDFEKMRDKVVSWREFMLLLIKYLDLAKPYLDKYNNKGSMKLMDYSMKYAAEEGRKDLIDFFILKGANDWNQGMYAAAKGGHKDLVDFFITKRFQRWDLGMYYAAVGGHKDLVELFISFGAEDWNLGMEGAIRGGHINLVEFFISLGADDWYSGMRQAAYYEDRELVDFFISKGANPKEWYRGKNKKYILGYEKLEEFFKNY